MNQNIAVQTFLNFCQEVIGLSGIFASPYYLNNNFYEAPQEIGMG